MAPSSASSSLPPRAFARPARRGGRPSAVTAAANSYNGAQHSALRAVVGRAPPQVAGDGGEELEDAGEGDDSDDDDDEEDGEDEDGNEDDTEDGVVYHGLEPDAGDVTEDLEGVDGDEVGIEEVPMDIDPPFDATGLKDIGNLASWTVSTYKPGCGVEALRDEDTDLFWQSDGPQPHHLNIHFSRFVSIVSIRIYLDFGADESYTPTRITLLAGTGYHDLIPFSSLEFTQPKGWIDVPLEGVGGGPDGNTLKAFLVQVKVVENHQNGKDTHVRGLKIYARDEKQVGQMQDLEQMVSGETKRIRNGKSLVERAAMLAEPDWMGEPELR